MHHGMSTIVIQHIFTSADSPLSYLKVTLLPYSPNSASLLMSTLFVTRKPGNRRDLRFSSMKINEVRIWR
jgi:hypothetical protein